MAIRREDGDGSVVAAHRSVRRCVGSSAMLAAMQTALSAFMLSYRLCGSPLNFPCTGLADESRCHLVAETNCQLPICRDR